MSHKYITQYKLIPSYAFSKIFKFIYIVSHESSCLPHEVVKDHNYTLCMDILRQREEHDGFMITVVSEIYICIGN